MLPATSATTRQDARAQTGSEIAPGRLNAPKVGKRMAITAMRAATWRAARSEFTTQTRSLQHG
jgi:hypothetical protein